MVYVALFITAELEGLTNLQPRNGFDDPDHPYLFKLKCENCGEISKKPSCVSLSEQVPLPNGRGTVQMIQKCKLCDREGTVEIISGQGKPLTEFHGQNHQHVQLVIFDCHGLSPVEFSFGGQWKAESTRSKTTFEIDLSRGEFADYDEDGNCAVSVSNLRSFFRVVHFSLIIIVWMN
ncbi:uncharacterized protein LOC144563289 isoform X2 [Carex rostrata]